MPLKNMLDLFVDENMNALLGPIVVSLSVISWVGLGGWGKKRGAFTFSPFFPFS